MHKSLLSLSFAALGSAATKTYYTDFDDLYPTREGSIGVYNDLDFSDFRLARADVPDSPIQGVQLNSTPNAVYYDGSQATLYSSNDGTIHLKRFNAGCVAFGRPTPCNVSIVAHYRDAEFPFNGQTVAYFRPAADETPAPIALGGLSTWRFYNVGKVNITTKYQDVSPEEGRTVIDDVVYCWDERVASCQGPF